MTDMGVWGFTGQSQDTSETTAIHLALLKAVAIRTTTTTTQSSDLHDGSSFPPRRTRVSPEPLESEKLDFKAGFSVFQLVCWANS